MALDKQNEPPKIEFPCKDYPVKILGDAGDELFDFVCQVTENYAPEFDRSKIKVKSSSKGRFDSITVLITATGVDQLSAYHQALKANPAIKIVL